MDAQQTIRLESNTNQSLKNDTLKCIWDSAQMALRLPPRKD